MLSPAQSWLEAARDPAIRAELEAVYAMVAAEAAARRPLCTASGRCCHFEQYGHRLYVTGLEAAYALVSLTDLDARLASSATGSTRETSTASPAPGTLSLPVVNPATAGTPAPPSPTSLTMEDVQAARARGDCPFLINSLCSIHAIKPLGCRVYYCDPTAQEWQMDLTERALARIRAIHERHGINYGYGEWRGMLETLLTPQATNDSP